MEDTQRGSKGASTLIFYLHFILLTSGLSGTSVLLGVFLKHYSDASKGEIGTLLMTVPFMALLIKPLFCSMADRHQAHRNYLIVALLVLMFGFSPFVAIPYFPDFYELHPRYSWYLLVMSCYLGNGGLAVAWSLGESLAINAAQRTGTPYAWLRLTGTLSWGVYGYVIGQINEIPSFPKFVPAFLILQVSVMFEVVLLLLWNKEHFVMVDDDQAPQITIQETQEPPMIVQSEKHLDAMSAANSPHGTLKSRDAKFLSKLNSTSGSVGGSLRLGPDSSMALHDLLFSEDLSAKLKGLEAEATDQEQSAVNKCTDKSQPLANPISISGTIDESKTLKQAPDPEAATEAPKKSPQILIFKMILREDGRLIKYLVLYIMAGILLAPMNFVFLSLDDHCKSRGCNFSNLAGSVLISQALIETCSFLVLPWILTKISRSVALFTALGILATRYFFYANYYYTESISPYWALVGEWGHGIGYGIMATILADVALMFASQCKLFITELRGAGILSPLDCGDKQRILREELAVRMALRATMQAVFGGFMDGLGQGIGSLICGLVVEAYSYIKLWHLMAILSISTLVVHQFIELTKSKWSDSFEPIKGTKAYDIRRLDVSNRKMNEGQANDPQVDRQKC